MYHPASSNRLNVEEKLETLRRLDTHGTWLSLDDRRCCTMCHSVITGRQIEVVGGTRGLGPLRLQCPTENCQSRPADWKSEADCGGTDPSEFTFYQHGVATDAPIPPSFLAASATARTAKPARHLARTSETKPQPVFSSLCATIARFAVGVSKAAASDVAGLLPLKSRASSFFFPLL